MKYSRVELLVPVVGVRHPQDIEFRSFVAPYSAQNVLAHFLAFLSVREHFGNFFGGKKCSEKMKVRENVSFVGYRRTYSCA